MWTKTTISDSWHCFTLGMFRVLTQWPQSTSTGKHPSCSAVWREEAAQCSFQAVWVGLTLSFMLLCTDSLERLFSMSSRYTWSRVMLSWVFAHADFIVYTEITFILMWPKSHLSAFPWKKKIHSFPGFYTVVLYLPLVHSFSKSWKEAELTQH